MRQVIYYGGSILTMEDVPAPEALLSVGGGIAALGDRAALEVQAPDAERVDLEGRALLPAFLDSHSHITALASTLELCQLGTADSFASIGETLRDFAAEHPPELGAWITGFGYDHNVLKERAHPTRQVLDRFFPDTPVLITHASGHMGVLNSAALRACGITADTPDPAGGKIGREEDGRTPNGYLEENAFRAAAAKSPMDRNRRGADLLRRAEEVYFSHGITVIQDGVTGQGEYQMLAGAAGAGALTADVVGYVDMEKAPELVKSPYWGRASNGLRLGGYKIFLDGSPQGRTAWMLEPYQGGGTYRGYPIYDDETVTGFVRRALEEGVQLLAHCNGDAAAAQYIRCCRTAQEQTGRPVREIRPVMIHAQLVRPEQLAEMAALGILPSFFAAHLWYWGDVHVENFGERRAASISPLSECVRLGLPFSLHQDTPVIQPDMLESLWCAVNRTTRSGRTLGPEYRITVREALKAVTVNAACQYFMEDRRGTLAVGKAADFVILDRNPLAVRPDELRTLRVLETIKNGETVYRARRSPAAYPLS